MWKYAGKEIWEIFGRLTTDIDLCKSTHIHEVEVLSDGRKHIHGKFDHTLDVNHVVFVCPAKAVGNNYTGCG